MYKNVIKAQEQAICHLFFHCCLKDGKFSDEELNTASARMVDVGLYKQLDFKEEVLKYQEYKNEIIDDSPYLDFLVEMITPVNTLALYSYCVELVLSDATLNAQEDILLEKLASRLAITAQEQEVTKKLVAQRRVVKAEKIL